MVAQLNLSQRVRFKSGKQREFLDSVRKRINSVSLRGVLQFGFNIPYSTLKSYFNENRLLPRGLFEDFCKISKLNPEDFLVEYLNWNWGQVKGGKKRKD